MRTILTELKRMASHQLWLGTHALDIGAMTPFFYTFREREEILKIFEKYCGARLTTHAFRIGGLPVRDLRRLRQRREQVSATSLRPRSTSTKNCSPPTASGWSARKTSAFSAPGVQRLGVTGPVLRASRREMGPPQGRAVRGLRGIRFRNSDRPERRHLRPVLVRMEEIRQSLRIIRQAVETIPEGPIIGKVRKVIKPPAGEIYHAIESPKGELGYFIVSDGSTSRIASACGRPRSATCRRWADGARRLVADVVALIGSLDIVLGEVDR